MSLFLFFLFFSFLPNEMEVDSMCNPLLQLAKIGKMLFILIGQESHGFAP